MDLSKKRLRNVLIVAAIGICWALDWIPLRLLSDFLNDSFKNPIIIGVLVWYLIKSDLIATLRGEKEQTDP